MDAFHSIEKEGQGVHKLIDDKCTMKRPWFPLFWIIELAQTHFSQFITEEDCANHDATHVFDYYFVRFERFASVYPSENIECDRIFRS